MKWFFSLVLILFSAFFLSACNPLEYKSKSGLQVITNDVASNVFINGQYLSKTPLIEKNIKPGVYHVLIQPEDAQYVAYETDITLRKGLLTVVTWKPEKRPELSSGVILEMEELSDDNKTEVSFVTIPEGAIITFDGKKEFSPVTLSDISPGVHEFEITLPSYETQRHSLNVQAGYKMYANVKLAKLQATGSEGAALSDSPAATTTAQTTPSPSPTATPAQSITPLGAAASNATVTILKTGFMQNGQEVLRVRETPANNGKEIGFAPVGQNYPYLSEQKNGWYKINFNGTTAWVNGAYAKLNQ